MTAPTSPNVNPEKTKEVPLIDKIAPVYSNLFQVEHTQEEFHLAFIILSGEQAQITSKVIVTPGHMKRLIATLQENWKMYENNFIETKDAGDAGVSDFNLKNLKTPGESIDNESGKKE